MSSGCTEELEEEREAEVERLRLYRERLPVSSRVTERVAEWEDVWEVESLLRERLRRSRLECIDLTLIREDISSRGEREQRGSLFLSCLDCFVVEERLFDVDRWRKKDFPEVDGADNEEPLAFDERPSDGPWDDSLSFPTTLSRILSNFEICCSCIYKRSQDNSCTIIFHLPVHVSSTS